MTNSLNHSAQHRLSKSQIRLLIILEVLLMIGLATLGYQLFIIITALVTIFYFVDLILNLYLINKSFFHDHEIKFQEQHIDQLERTWPKYTILSPLYKESKILPQYVKAIQALNYPKDQLEVLLLLEASDTKTIDIAQQSNLPDYFKIKIVPESNPKTKPKACNYGLTQANGEYVVIYDAEDIPDPYQLKKAILAFENLPTNIMCIQSKLNYYNPDQNFLTKLFTAEYSLWFDLILTGLQSIKAPIPLGGTSNHFRTQQLLSLGAWDPYNVTEDADLGIRIARVGGRTAVLDSTTMEEANSELFNWFRQRSRWIKGYIQTYFVHTRDPIQFIKQAGFINFILFQIILGGKTISMIINPILWLTTIAYFAFYNQLSQPISSLFPPAIMYVGAISLFIGNFIYIYYYLMGLAKRGYWSLAPYALLAPIYWIFMSVSASIAVFEFIVRPHYWHKTTHGLHLAEEKTPSTPLLRPAYS